MMLDKLQYISQGKTALEQQANISKALDNGVQWVQLRWKNTAISTFFSLAGEVKKICETYKAICIINDHIDIARTVDADGVHLGLKDASIADARAILGEDKIIGGTANTLGDIIQRTAEQCDYIGLGPFRFTTTKEKLSPVLGLPGYRNMMQILEKEKIACPPVYAIGGIELSDIEALKATGVHGIALSGLITHQPELTEQIKDILR